MPEAAAILDESDLPALQQARRLWGQNRWDEAEAAFLKIADAHPNNFRALVDAARVLGDRMQIRRAQAMLDKLVSLAGDRADLLLLLGQTMRMCHREDEALALFRRYTSGPGKRDLAGHLELAVLCERHRFLDEADAAATAALKVAPDCMEALIIRARVRRQQGQPDRAEAALKRVTSFPKTHLSTRAQAWCMLADMADCAGDAPAAMQLLERAKELLRPVAGDMVKTAHIVLGAWDRVCRALTPEIIRHWINAAGIPAFRRPAAHLLSFPRSGTTLLENILDTHSGIVSSEEFQVLGRDLLNILWRDSGEVTPPTIDALDAISPEKLDTLRREYRERMEEGLGEPVGDRVHIDKNPTHTLFIPGILRLLPDSRFLVALRDPRDVVVSCYFQYLPANPNSARHGGVASSADGASCRPLAGSALRGFADGSPGAGPPRHRISWALVGGQRPRLSPSGRRKSRSHSQLSRRQRTALHPRCGTLAAICKVDGAALVPAAAHGGGLRL
jgi:Tfp pilus assembly protein PilF